MSALSLAPLLLSLAGTPAQSGATRPWTILVYGGADNNADGPILEFLDQVRKAIDDDPGIELLLLLDRSEKFSDDAQMLGEDFHGGRLYRLRKDSAERLSGGEQFPELVLDEDATYCPVRATLALLGQKWIPRIVYELMHGKRRFNELAGAVGGCNSRTLRDRLKVLEELEIIQRDVIAVMPPWVEYQLTPKGRELGIALNKLEAWGRSYMAEPIS